MNGETIVYAVQKGTIIISEVTLNEAVKLEHKKTHCLFFTHIEAIQYTNDLTREYSKHLGEYLKGK